MLQLEFAVLSKIAAAHGLNVVGFTSSEPLIEHSDHLQSWQNNGYAGEMHYMKRDANLMSAPANLSSGVKTIVVFSISYDRGPQLNMEPGYGRVARYAWGKDYHRVIKKKFKGLIKDLELHLGASFENRAFSDSVPLLERALAERAGMGFFGKNAMLIRPKVGSFFFLAELLLDIAVIGPSLKIIDESCGSCSRCISNCPTSAIVDDFTVDARRCISYLTIEKKGMLSSWEREALGEWIFGCDVCQEVCPFNHTALKNEEAPDLQEFSSSCGSGGLLNLKILLETRLSEDFSARFAGTPLMRAGRIGLLRNAASVAANTNAESVLTALEGALIDDASEVVRASCLWSISKLYKTNGVGKLKKARQLLSQALNDPHEIVRLEAQDIFSKDF